MLGTLILPQSRALVACTQSPQLRMMPIHILEFKYPAKFPLLEQCTRKKIFVQIPKLDLSQSASWRGKVVATCGKDNSQIMLFNHFSKFCHHISHPCDTNMDISSLKSFARGGVVREGGREGGGTKELLLFLLLALLHLPPHFRHRNQDFYPLHFYQPAQSNSSTWIPIVKGPNICALFNVLYVVWAVLNKPCQI